MAPAYSWAHVSTERVYISMKPGDTLFFHPLLVHGSGAHRSQEFRKSISCHYVASDVDVINESQSPSLGQVSGEYRDDTGKECSCCALVFCSLAQIPCKSGGGQGMGWAVKSDTRAWTGDCYEKYIHSSPVITWSSITRYCIHFKD